MTPLDPKSCFHPPRQVSVNEELDPALVIERLSTENAELRAEVRCGEPSQSAQRMMPVRWEPFVGEALADLRAQLARRQ